MPLSSLLVLIVIPTALLVLTGCADTTNSLNAASALPADVATRVEEMKTGVGNVVRGIEEARDTIVEKKRQLDEATTNVSKAVDSVHTLLGTNDTK